MLTSEITPRSETTPLSTRDIAPRIATEIRADKATLLSGVHAARIRALLEQRGVLVFPRIGFTDEEKADHESGPDGAHYMFGALPHLAGCDPRVPSTTSRRVGA